MPARRVLMQHNEQRELFPSKSFTSGLDDSGGANGWLLAPKQPNVKSAQRTSQNTRVQRVSWPITVDEPPLEEALPQRPLTSLKWPYVPDESAYPDPLKRDDPKTLQLHHYEAIATSPSIRKTLATHPNLKKLLVSIDSLRGNDREHALQRALGVAAPDIKDLSAPAELSEDILALRELAEAIEGAVRGGQEGALGLDWDSTDL
ncbi:hypothetical protein H0H87_000285 [Tephrocybe sp. NHM501043]|nr:hypothetical protein H0H87_000285 [Tephrocybe sp. NHM501043]